MLLTSLSTKHTYLGIKLTGRYYYCQILTKLGYSRQSFIKVSNIKFQENLSSGSREPSWYKRQKDTTIQRDNENASTKNKIKSLSQWSRDTSLNVAPWMNPALGHKYSSRQYKDYPLYICQQWSDISMIEWTITCITVPIHLFILYEIKDWRQKRILRWKKKIIGNWLWYGDFWFQARNWKTTAREKVGGRRSVRPLPENAPTPHKRSSTECRGTSWSVQ